MRKSAICVGIANAIAALIMAIISVAISFTGAAAIWIMSVWVVVIVTAFALVFPVEIYTPTPGTSRIAAIAAGVASAIAGIAVSTAERFGIALFLLMTALIAGGFLFEMLRRDRSQLIKSLSSIIFMGTLGLVSSGWTATGLAKAYVLSHPRGMWVVLACVVVGEIAICMCAALWSHDALVQNKKNEISQETAGTGEDTENVKAEVVHTSRIPLIYRYSGIAALLSGIFPLGVVLISGVMNNL
ncbi:hypothetical protein EJ419_06425 [Alloscardovia theropitheci]|uniref:Uncharacterized protein n=1 Tax=Alloscardovia theropitheci TaxID=2496842 RepID=A0A4R0QNX1_9BIFI|nr:hypothetical protein [Alloscardovia theropitheci]TCD53884.1 hypothetical protein EJ419_06425 [Alloscardovia theropitheci]